MRAQEHVLKSSTLTKQPFQLIFWNQKLTVQHDHDFHEVVIVLRGLGMHCTEKDQYLISPGEVIVIPPKEIHCYKDVDDLYVANLLLDMEQLPIPIDEWHQFNGFTPLFDNQPISGRAKQETASRHFSLDVDSFTQIRHILEKMKLELEQKKNGYKLASTLMVMELLITILRCYSTSSKPMSYQMMQLTSMLQFMQNNLQRKISLQELSRRGNMSIRTVNRVFQSLLKTSPLQHFTDLRMKSAAQKLRIGKQPISHIAYEYGFSDSNHFTTAFRNHFGISPRKYQKKCQQEEMHSQTDQTM